MISFFIAVVGTVLNSGEIEVWSGGYGVGIIAAAIEGDATVVNSGDIDVRNAGARTGGAYATLRARRAPPPL